MSYTVTLQYADPIKPPVTWTTEHLYDAKMYFARQEQGVKNLPSFAGLTLVDSEGVVLHHRGVMR